MAIIKEHSFDRIQLLDDYPVPGQPVNIRCWKGETYQDLHTSTVRDFSAGYPRGGGISIKTAHSVYSGDFNPENDVLHGRGYLMDFGAAVASLGMEANAGMAR